MSALAYEELDGLPNAELARIRKRIWRIQRARQNERQLVSVEPFQAAYRTARARDGLTTVEVARRIGWITSDGWADGIRVRRALGLAPRYVKGVPVVNRWVQPKTALALCRVFGLAPRDVGL